MAKVKFIVAEVTREDLDSQGYSSDVDDATMEKIAFYMGEVITSCDYWSALDYACEKCGIKNTED